MAGREVARTRLTIAHAHFRSPLRLRCADFKSFHAHFLKCAPSQSGRRRRKLRRATFFARGASPSSSSSSPSWLRGLSRRTRHHSSSAETRNLVGTGVSTPSAIHANATNALPSARLRLPRTPSTRADGVRGHDKCIRTLSSTCHFAHVRPGPPEARQTALRSRCSSAPG